MVGAGGPVRKCPACAISGRVCGARAPGLAAAVYAVGTFDPTPAMSSPAAPNVRTYKMGERANHPDFDIRFQGARDELTQVHRHDYFQIQVGLEGETSQAIGGAVRPFGRGVLSFVLPHRMHVIPHPPGSRYCIINFDQRLLWPALDVDALELDALPFATHPELAPFLFQEYVDFAFDEPDFARILGWLDEMLACNATRGFGEMTMIRGILQQLIGFACLRQQAALRETATRHDGRVSRHDALQRVLRYVRDNLAGELSLTDAAQAAILSPTYLANLLKRETGQTFTELVTARRMARAKELLLTTALPIGDVATRCGYEDEAYFSRRFRHSEGCTARAFRAARQARLAR